MSGPHTPLDQVATWEVPHVTVAVQRLDDGAVLAQVGDVDQVYRLASVAKLVAAYAVMIGVEEEAVTLDDEVGPAGSTLRHLLAHTSGLGFEARDPVLSSPGQRRVYSNAGIEAAADHLAAATGIAFADYLGDAVLKPLGMTSTTLQGSPAHALHATVRDLQAFAREVAAPTLLDPSTVEAMTTVQFPGLSGVVPGVGRFDPCDWGLGFEHNFGRPGHWAGPSVAPTGYGHFGGAGTFVWFDPVARLACICLTDRPFDAWAMQVWPPLCDAVIDTYGA